MDRKTQEVFAACGMIFGISLALGSGALAEHAYSEAETITSIEVKDSLDTIGIAAHGANLGGVAIALASGIAMSRLGRQSVTP